MNYLGDYEENHETLSFKFTTKNVSAVPTTLAGIPVVSIYKTNDLVQSIAGVALTVDFDGITGLHNVLIDLSSDAFYAQGGDYQAVITTGTVNGVSVVGEVIAEFSINNRYQTPISVGSAAVSTPAESAVLTTGTEVNSYTDTETLNGIRHEISDVAGALELYYQFDVGGNGIAVTIEMVGRLNGSNDDIGVFAYNWGALSWDQIGNMEGSNSSTDGGSEFNLLTRHTGAGANLGKVRIRGYAASGLTSATLHIDQAFVSYSIVTNSVGYSLGRVWIDTDSGTNGTEVFVNGTADNPVKTVADALTIAASLGLHELAVSPDSIIVLASNLQGFNVYGVGYSLDFAGFDVAGSHFYHSSPTVGKMTTTGGADHYDQLDSIVGNMEVDDAHYTNCSFNGTIALDQLTSGDLKIINSRSIIAGASTPIIDCGVAAVTHNISIANWQNGIEIRNLNNGGSNLFSISGTGKLVVAATCSGTMNVRGAFQIVDNSGGNVTFVFDDIHEDTHEIKAKADQLTFTKANELDSNTQSINGVAIIGDGSTTPFDV